MNDHFARTGIPATFAFNLPSIPSITYGSVPADWTPVSGSTQTNGNIKMPGAGYFDFALSWVGILDNKGKPKQGSSNPGPSVLSFTISAPGLKLSSLSKNAGNYFFAMDILQGCIIGAYGKCGANATGVVGVKGNGVVSEPPVDPVHCHLR